MAQPFTASWAARRRTSVTTPPLNAPASPAHHECSDSDDDGSETSSLSDATKALFSPVSADLLTSIVIFGADGDLARKKILPTIFNLWRRKLLPRDLVLFGYAREPLDDERFRRTVFNCIYNPAQPQSERKEFMQRVHYQGGQFGDPVAIGQLVSRLPHHHPTRLISRKASYGPLRQLSEDPEAEPAQQVRMYYMAVPPFLYAQICSALRPVAASAQASAQASAKASPLCGPTVTTSSQGEPSMSSLSLHEGGDASASVGPFAAAAAVAAATSSAGQSSEERFSNGEERDQLAALADPLDGIETVERFVLEKPFGRDSASCAAMIRELAFIPEEELYRIDHYLGKELVMNLLVLRFANVCFQAIWNRQHIKGVQVIFKEDFGVEGRAGYFDQYGMIRDVMQNHLLQVMALIAMEQPLSFEAEHIRAEKLKVLQAVRPLVRDNLAVGQYSGTDSKLGYLDDPSLQNKDSCTETFAAAVLHVHNPRWDGVPFVLKARPYAPHMRTAHAHALHIMPALSHGVLQAGKGVY
jgi:glucose-6-phosphate 1-dehydrogenase